MVVVYELSNNGEPMDRFERHILRQFAGRALFASPMGRRGQRANRSVFEWIITYRRALGLSLPACVDEWVGGADGRGRRNLGLARGEAPFRSDVQGRARALAFSAGAAPQLALRSSVALSARRLDPEARRAAGAVARGRAARRSLAAEPAHASGRNQPGDDQGAGRRPKPRDDAHRVIRRGILTP